MSELPTGTVTFLFTDLEGSTRRWELTQSLFVFHLFSCETVVLAVNPVN